MDLNKITKEVGMLAIKAGNFIKNEHNNLKSNDIETKDKASLVTYVDKEAEKMIVVELKNIFPEAEFLTEEKTINQVNSEYRWVVDPLDGTTNYIHGIFPHSVSIALTHNNIPIIGVVYEIGNNELFTAWKNGGAYLNEEKISVSKSSKHEDVLLATGFPYYNFNKLDGYLNVLKFFMIETRGMRRMGSAAVDLAYVACGRFDGFFEHALHAWDVAAGIILVQEAGGKVSDFKGKENYLFGIEIIASNSSYYNSFYKIINKYLG